MNLLSSLRLQWLAQPIIFLLVLTVLVGEPAPSSIGLIELVMVGLSLLSFVFVAVKYRHPVALPLQGERYTLLELFLLYILVWIYAALLGSARGTGSMGILRAITPYLVFAPVILLGVSLAGSLSLKAIAVPLAAAGFLQAVYLLYLYFSTVAFADPETVVLRRTTLLDPRTTVPLFLALAILPLPYVFGKSTYPVRLLALMLTTLACAAALSTQTRSQLLAIAGGGVVYAYLHFRLRKGRIRLQEVRRAGPFILAFGLLCGLAFLFVPGLRNLALAMLMRVQSTGDTGRIAEEWIPALKQMLDSGPLGPVLGMGLGVPFVSETTITPLVVVPGDARTFTHNLIIYLVVYTGVIGLTIVAVFHFYVFRLLVRLAEKSRNTLYLAFAALLAGLFIYSQFFAVYRLLSYNLMLVLICTTAFLAERGLDKHTATLVMNHPDAP